MDLSALTAEIEKKRKLLEENDLVNDKRKYFKLSELYSKTQEDVRTCDNKNDNDDQAAQSSSNDAESNHVETDLQAFKRLRKCEISEPESNKGLRNDFQEAMEKVDQDYLDAIMSQSNPDTSKDSKTDIKDPNETYDDIQEKAENLGRGNSALDMEIILSFLQLILQMWNNQLNSLSGPEKTGTRAKIAMATYNQTQIYLKPLFRKLKSKKLPEDILDSLTTIVKHLLDRNYIMASDAYLQMAIGNAPWPIGVTMVGIHARTGREKIFSKNVAHVLNDETQRKYIQALKRLMTKCQQYFPTDPSRCVEYTDTTDL